MMDNYRLPKVDLEVCRPLLGGKGSVQDEGGEGDELRVAEVRLPQGNTSPWGAVFIVINAALGAGLLTFPSAFYSAGGVLPALLVMAFLLVWIALGLIVLAHLAETLQASTYEEVVGRACGPVVKAVVDSCIIVYTFGTCIAFLVVIGDQLQDLSSAIRVRGKVIAGEWWIDRRLLMSLAALLLLPWLWMKRIGVLSYTSALGVLCLTRALQT
jgi:sodium-coupled neutral amino acid transporter 7/8